jgi:hypothetical protein
MTLYKYETNQPYEEIVDLLKQKNSTYALAYKRTAASPAPPFYFVTTISITDDRAKTLNEEKYKELCVEYTLGKSLKVEGNTAFFGGSTTFTPPRTK